MERYSMVQIKSIRTSFMIQERISVAACCGAGGKLQAILVQICTNPGSMVSRSLRLDCAGVSE
jgi:hypothetical protein